MLAGNDILFVIIFFIAGPNTFVTSLHLPLVVGSSPILAFNCRKRTTLICWCHRGFYFQQEPILKYNLRSNNWSNNWSHLWASNSSRCASLKGFSFYLVPYKEEGKAEDHPSILWFREQTHFRPVNWCQKSSDGTANSRHWTGCSSSADNQPRAELRGWITLPGRAWLA